MTMTHAIRCRAVLLAALGAVALAGLPASPAVAQDTSAVAVNTRDGSSIFRLAFNIRRVTGDVVDQSNAAVAVSSCEECRTVAISFQVLLVESDPSLVSPENLALAYNQDCTLCDTFAAAYQIVLGDGTRLRFTAEGSKAIAGIRRELKALRNQDLSDADLDAQLDGIYGRLKGVLDTELVGVGQPGATQSPAGAPESGPTATQPPAQTTPTPATPAPTPAQTPAQTTPAQTTPAQTVPQQTTTAPTPTQTTP
jgi:putative peptide zinc metalloprotease protein